MRESLFDYSFENCANDPLQFVLIDLIGVCLRVDIERV